MVGLMGLEFLHKYYPETVDDPDAFKFTDDWRIGFFRRYNFSYS